MTDDLLILDIDASYKHVLLQLCVVLANFQCVTLVSHVCCQGKTKGCGVSSNIWITITR